MSGLSPTAPPPPVPPPPLGAPYHWTLPAASWPPEIVRSLGEIRKGANYYQYYLLLGLLAGLLTTAGAVVSGVPSVEGVTIPSASSLGNNNTTAVPSLFSGPGAGLAILGGVLSVIGFVVLLVAWITWRGGVLGLAREAGGPYAGPPGAAADEAEHAYGRTVLTFILGIVVTVVLATVIVGAIVASVLVQCSGTGACTGPTTDQANALRTEIIATVILIGALGALISLLAYHFATRSFAAALRGFGDSEGQRMVAEARPWILGGAALALIGLAAVINPALGVLAAVSPLVVFLGFRRVVAGYDAWLEHPPVPPVAPAAAPLR